MTSPTWASRATRTLTVFVETEVSMGFHMIGSTIGTCNPAPVFCRTVPVEPFRFACSNIMRQRRSFRQVTEFRQIPRTTDEIDFYSKTWFGRR